MLSKKIQDLMKEDLGKDVICYLNIAYLLQKQAEESPKIKLCKCVASMKAGRHFLDGPNTASIVDKLNEIIAHLNRGE